ncbi:hypothetical protein [Mesorhizobium sp.]|uniref:hypothetical protein n=1 Tax=Mesorhizobium sp. TaxID=1871066 RepID=UPI000FE303F3|nr:hypothetical protein [Mesorhizobium sp.]RWN55573.1 MAG: hypothetical protein EOR98_12265 [Mesorhizobium sp.]RWN77277.1 MAG: hypothetical protein EOS02_12230 [Mesorhizobium sp.]RWN80184.1 MAG: hypothetical protein EOS01_12330 [Mesorhizobium sp.]RWN86097.1 MAG: hypothetical protein EOS04_19595 [Mesorhizobium sp.]RWO15013.1 MAG: hypothetical protein EOS15_12005 [Mesorhizobium sp.]
MSNVGAKWLVGRSLRVLALVMLAGWVAAFILFMSQYATKIPRTTFFQWYATVAMSNNFAFLLLVAIPFLLAFAPFGLFVEWIAAKGEHVERLALEEADLASKEVERLHFPAPPKPPTPTGEELAAMKEKTRHETDRTAAYIADYFGGSGPAPAKSRVPAYRRGRRRRRY